MKKAKFIFRYLLILIAAIVVGVNFQAAVSSKLTGDKVPMPFGIGASVVLSGSMEPELKVGDLIIINKYGKGQEPEIGDVIVYQSGTMAIVHRVVDIEGDTIITQGDANNASDEPFSRSAVKGKVVFRAAVVGYLVLFLKTPLGIGMTLALAFLFLELSYRKEKRQKEESLEAMKEEIRRLLEEQKK